MKKFSFLIIVYVFCIVCFSGDFVRILHTNDFHGHILPKIDKDGVEIGGIARIAKKIEHITSLYPDTLVLDAGDFISGFLYANFDTGETVVEIYKQIPFTAIVPGNHEFDYGYENMKKILAPFEDKIVCANVYSRGKRVYQPFIIKEVNNLRVLIMGVTTPEIKRFALGLDEAGVFVSLPQNEVRKILSQNRDKYDVSILLSHIGFEEDVKIAQEFSNLDIIIGGHTHTLLKVPPVFNNTIVNQAGAYGERLGFLRAYYEKVNDKTVMKYYNSDLAIPLKSWGENQVIKNIVDVAEQKVIAISSQIVGEALDVFPAGKKDVRMGETAIGNVISESLLYLSKADFAVMNGGGIRSSLNKGAISAADVEKVLPFKNNAMVIKVTGKKLIENFGNSLQALKIPKLSGAFLQVAGIKVEYDLENEKVKLFTSNGKAIEENKEYTFALNDYMKNGGDGYLFKECEEIENYVTGKPLKDILTEYIRKMQKISPKKDGRIVIK
ncbi:MAG: bifunctional metallophosphatase/5'-nucleotidase [Candidatus Absconditabacterales bacterium]|nr:bifunctional metallophosphatase/5'-nucleotidase [Candidatus Absconditabacterales bacterium]